VPRRASAASTASNGHEKGRDQARPDFTCDTIAVMHKPVRKAVFPAAVWNAFPAATKAQPKEMLVLVDKPVIQYGVEEAVASGIDNIVDRHGARQETPSRITSTWRSSWKASSSSAARLEQLEESAKITRSLNVSYVRQGEPLGLGHAVLVAKNLVATNRSRWS
jgi:UTP--glucose-1-phosphate uridylyltransferase